MARNWPPERIWDDPEVWMATAPNPGPKTLSGTHTYIIGTDPAYVIDPGPDLPSYAAGLAGWLTDTSRRPGGILLTHSHPDHTPGAALLNRLWPAPVLHPDGGQDPASADGRSIPLSSDELVVLATPGHAPDHVCFWLPRARVLFAGDVVLGEGSTLISPPEGNMVDYLRTLRRLQTLHARLIAPGHGPLVHDARAKLAEYIAHREERERQVLNALRDHPRSVTEIVAAVYTDVPASLHELAAESVRAQLDKLQAEGRTVAESGVYRLVGPSQ